MRERGTVLGAIPEAAGTCRSIVSAALRTHELDALCGDAESVVAELAANAITAVLKDAGDGLPVIKLALAWPPGGIRIEVWDQSPEMPLMREPDWESESGRGLFLVDTLTGGRWGCLKAGASKCVWAEMSA